MGNGASVASPGASEDTALPKSSDFDELAHALRTMSTDELAGALPDPFKRFLRERNVTGQQLEVALAPLFKEDLNGSSEPRGGEQPQAQPSPSPKAGRQASLRRSQRAVFRQPRDSKGVGAITEVDQNVMLNHSSAEQGALTLIIGTLNLISDDENPFQFEPPEWQMQMNVGREDWNAALATASAAYESFTLGEALAILDEIASRDGVMSPARTEVAQAVRSHVLAVVAKANVVEGADDDGAKRLELSVVALADQGA